MRELAKVVVELPCGWSQSAEWRACNSYPLDVEMLFGGSELRMTATVRSTGEAAVTTVAYCAD
jgi:hypothetical protein